MKYLVIVAMRAIGLPYDLRVETTAASEAQAKANALHLLKHNGHKVFNVTKSTFAADLSKFMTLHRTRPELSVLLADADTDVVWTRAICLRRYVHQ